MGATTPAKPRRSPEEKSAYVDSILWHALGRHANKQADRELLVAGEKHEVRLDVAGHVNGEWIERQISGELTVDHDQNAASSSAPDQVHLVALLLESMPKTKRHALLAALPTQFVEQGELPAVADETRSAAKTLLEKLRTVKTGTKRGNVAFRPTA